MALSTAARRAIAIRNSVAKRTSAKPANDNQVVTKTRHASGARTAIVAACIEAGGFEQHAAR